MPARRLKIVVRGAVQGVGFRPFIYRLATSLGLAGWVNNSAQGVFLEVEGSPPLLDQFLLRIAAEKPPRSFIQSLEHSWLDAVGYAEFQIRESDPGGAKTALVLPDIATCPDCLREIMDPHDRRHFYPFTNCTNCGPRFSIIESLPYDRANTSMKQFSMCPECQSEYDDPRDRRFHAQPNACPRCGPHVEFWAEDGHLLAGPLPASAGAPNEGNRRALEAAAKAIASGQIVAVKGLGGFHLMVAAHDEGAVRRLRERKRREEKPFALMFPSVTSVRQACELSTMEERVLRSPEAPILLLRRLSALSGSGHLAEAIAPGNPNLGAMLPYTPLHHLLLALLGSPVVATSGNLSDEPICIDEQEAVERLGGIADRYLVHDRPIVRHVDDSMIRVMLGREQVLRRARGFAPLPIRMPGVQREGASVLGVGPHLKNTVALSAGPDIFVSQHIGDLETDQAYEAFRRVIADFERLYEVQPAVIAADMHPDYLSTQFARAEVSAATAASPPQYVSVQHHVAHVLSCMAENELRPPVLGVSWDGTGYGLDGTVWGGEFFVVTDTGWDRVAHLRQFRLPGGDKAVKEPRRTALGLLFETFGDRAFELSELAPVRAFSRGELEPLRTMLRRGLNAPLTSSAGRLFDALAALVGLRQQVRFEGQAAIELEFALEGAENGRCYELSLVESTSSPTGNDRPFAGSPLVLDWAPMVQALLCDLRAGVPVGEISAAFHNGLVEAIVELARRQKLNQVVLSGGCFQNRYLTERAVERLQEEGFRPYWHQRVPPNDGGISLGQVAASRWGKGMVAAGIKADKGRLR